MLSFKIYMVSLGLLKAMKNAAVRNTDKAFLPCYFKSRLWTMDLASH